MTSAKLTCPPGIDRTQAALAAMRLAREAREAPELADWLHMLGLLANPGDYRALPGVNPMGRRDPIGKTTR